MVPRGIVAQRHYCAGAIAFACLLLGLLGQSLEQVRRRIAPGRTVEPGWPVMRRWLEAVRQGRLFPFVRGFPPTAKISQRAERVATTVMAFASGTFANPEAHLYAGIELVL